MAETSDFLPLDASDLDNYLGQPLPMHQLREPVAVNDIRRWAQGMHYPNPLHFDPDYAAESRFGRIVAPQSFVASTEIAHGVWPANIGRIPDSHLIFGGDEWWFFGPRIYPGEHIKCYPMPFDYKVTDTSFAGPRLRCSRLSAHRWRWPSRRRQSCSSRRHRRFSSPGKRR